MNENNIATQAAGQGQQTEGNTQQDRGTGAAGERTFTQEEVNRIVQDRLAKEKNKTSQTFDERLNDLTNRENRMTCLERLVENKYPKELVDMLDTSNPDKFMENVEKLAAMGLQGGNTRPIPRVVSYTGGIMSSSDADFRQAFGLKERED